MFLSNYFALEFDQMRVCLVVLGLVAQTIVADQSRIVPSNGNLLVSLNFMHLHLLSLVHTIPGQGRPFLFFHPQFLNF